MRKVLPFLLLALIVSGCSIKVGSSQKAPVVVGVFKSFDRSQNWSAKHLFIHSGGTSSLAGVNVTNLFFDPQDTKAIYLATPDKGLFYSYDGANSWMKAGSLGDREIKSVAIDPTNKCVIYVAITNTINKSVDCNRSWQEVYIDTRADKGLVNAVAIDSYNNLTLYIGNELGEVLKSIDGGSNWQTVNRLKDPIRKILVDPNDSRIVYVATKGKGIFKTIDGGATWSDLNAALKKFSGALEFRNLLFDVTQPNSLLLVAKYGLLKTTDGGENWTEIKLITPPASTEIYGVAINPVNNLEIFYSTKSTFYQTKDGGANWVTRRLPTKGTAAALLIDPKDQNIMYMGLRNLDKK